MTMQILVVDDDRTVCCLLTRLCERRDAAVSCVRDGKTALEMIAGDQLFDLIFLDLVLPNVSGWDVLEAIRADQRHADTRVVILSGASISGQEKDRLGATTTSFVDKRAFRIATIEHLLDDMLADS